MSGGLLRYQHTRQLHYITFTCFHRASYLATASARELFEKTLERVRRWYGFYLNAYVVMPEHVHLLMSEPERTELCVAIQMLKQIVARRLRPHDSPAFWQRRYYDFNVRSDKKFVEKVKYIHQNPVRRGLVEHPEDWRWSSFLHYATGGEGPVEIESQWTARKRERMGIVPRVKECR